MTSPTLSYDADAQALYIRMSNRTVTNTVEISQSVYVDVDDEGNAVGFEVLGVDSPLLAHIPDLPDDMELRQLLKDRAA